MNHKIELSSEEVRLISRALNICIASDIMNGEQNSEFKDLRKKIGMI